MDIQHLYDIYLACPKISTDSRQIEKDSIFFALKGTNFDGNDFASQSLDSGAKYVVVDAPKFSKSSLPFIFVENVLTSLQQLANYHRQQLSIPVLALTGSNGKTTSKELIYAVLNKKFKAYATFGNLNNHIGLPLTILRTPRACEFLILEMGANHQGEIEALCQIAQPDHVMITNIGKAHLEGFGGTEGVKRGKSEIYRYAAQNKKHIFLREDDKILSTLLPHIANVTQYSVGNMFTNVSAENSLSFHFNGKRVNTQLYGEYNLANIGLAISIGKYFGVEEDNILDALKQYLPTNNRSEMMFLGSNQIVLDAYNANPTSMAASIESFAKIKGENKILILGDMLELGEESIPEHKMIINLVKKMGFNEVYFIGKNFIKSGEQSFGCYFEDTFSAKNAIKLKELTNKTILLKGSRGIGLENLLKEN